MARLWEYKKLDTYTHMGPFDAALWERFMVAYPHMYESVAYDESVGGGEIPQNDGEPNQYKENFADLTKFRIDVIGYRKDGSADIIELRPRAGLSAIGHTLGGTHLFIKENPHTSARAMIVTDTAQSDMGTLCRAHSVILIELDKI